MRIPRIYQDTLLQTGQCIELDKAAAHHLSRVLRLKHQDKITLFNGRGGEYSAQIIINGKKLSADITEFHDRNPESNLKITLLQGISKGDRMDISIQKAVELGVHAIVPVICQRTVVNLKQDRADKKYRHWQGIIINACEQSGRTQVPVLHPVIKLHDIDSDSLTECRLTLDPLSDNSLQDITPTNSAISLLIGPEGGLSQDEIEYVCSLGFQGVQMGPRILRTETAALAGVAVLQSLWGDFKSSPI